MNSKMQGSSSGCSSGIGASVSDRKEEKKKQVKKCLAELKSLVQTQKGGRKNTLNTLQHVIARMKRFKDDADGSNLHTGSGTEQYDTEQLGGALDGETGGIRFSIPQSTDLEQDPAQFKYRILLSAKHHEVLEASTELVELLGYPKNYWHQRLLTNYVYKKDIVTLNSNFVFDSKATEDDGEKETKQNLFFFRLRHYKSLRQGFSLTRPNKFSVFCAKATVQKGALDLPSGATAQATTTDSKHIVLDLKLMESAYKNHNALPEEQSFVTRHTTTCNYNFVHPSAIPLLGYLPQDMIGASVFDFYHPHDLSVLLGIYQEVLNRPGKTYKSIPYRIRASNGDYVTVATEWSSYVNPWTHKLDCIIAQSEIIQGPTNLNVFTDGTTVKCKTVEVEAHHRSLQKKIRTLLQQMTKMPCTKPTRVLNLAHLPSVPSPTDTTTNTPISSFTSSSNRDSKIEKSGEIPETCEQPIPTDYSEENQDDLVSHDYENTLERLSQTDSVPGGADVVVTEDEKTLIYQRLHYAQNIRRFLLGTNSNTTDSSEEQQLQKESTSDTNSGSDDFSVDMNLPLPKPPSFASSTKV